MATVDQINFWLKRLGIVLDKRAPVFKLFGEYYDGDHRLAFATDKFRATFGNLFSPYSDNFCGVVVDAEEERLNIDGFRFPAAPSDEEVEGVRRTIADPAAQRIWQRNALDADSQMAHIEALVKGECPVLIWPDKNGDARVYIESADTMAVAFDPSDRTKRVAALKRWRDEDKYVYATLYLPDGIYKFRSEQRVHAQSHSRVKWVRRDVNGEAWPLNNPWNVLTVVPLINRKRIDGWGRSELADVIPRQDAINKLATDMLVAAEYVAFPQRWATGIEIPKGEDGEPTEEFKSAINRLWHVEHDNAKFGQFQAADLKPYVDAIESQLHRLASATRTPPHYFMAGMGQFPSGESLKSSETGLVSKVRRAMRHFGESWEEIQRVAFMIEGDTTRADDQAAETIWHDPESRSEGEMADSAIKQKELGVPLEKLWERLGYTPTEIAEMKRMREEEALTIASAFDPFAPTPPTPNAQGAAGASDGAS